MALMQKQRLSIYTGLAPLLGEPEAEALLAQLPSDDLDTPATKDFVRAEVSNLRSEMMNRLRSQTIWLSGVILAAAGLIRFA